MATQVAVALAFLLFQLRRLDTRLAFRIVRCSLVLLDGDS
jgi:hypothetical protein